MHSTRIHRTPAQRLIAASMIVLHVFVPVLYSSAASAADAAGAAVSVDRNQAGQKPIVNVAANGVPVVQIAPPSAAGVSSNLFTQYNVGSSGLILNNSGANSQTQLAGWVAGNPMLGNSSARVILNQVTGATPSSLNGYTEVAGNRANVIVANPNGITCNGCGFINAPRVTLTTGTPNMGAAGVTGFDVHGGQISIEGQGLNGGNLDQLDLISRSLRVNAQLWTNRLEVATGANHVDYTTGAATAAAGNGQAPTVAIDVAQLGGMYANSIRMVGTENGVGVNSAGTIAALTGDLQIDNAGDIRITRGQLQAKGNLSLSGRNDIVNNGTLYAEGANRIAADGKLQNSGLTISGAGLQVQAASLANTGTLASGIDAQGQASVAADTSIVAQGSLQNSGAIVAGGNVSLAGANIALDAGQVSAAGRIDAASAGSLSNTAGAISANRVSLTSGDTIDNAHGDIEGQALNLTAQGIDNRNGVLMHAGTGDFSLNVSKDINNQGGEIAANAVNFSLSGNTIDNTGGRIIHAGSGSLAVNATSAFGNAQGTVVSNGTATVQAGTIANAGGTIQAQGGLNLNGTGGIDNSGGGLLALGSIVATTQGSFSNQAGTLSANGNVSLKAAGIANAEGNVTGGGDVGLQGGSLDNTKGAVLSQGKLDAQIVDGIVNTQGKMQSAQTLTVSATTLDNTGGNVLGTGTAPVSVALSGSLVNDNGFVGGNGAVAVGASQASNRSGTIHGKGNLAVTVGSTIDNTAGAIQSDAALDVDAGGKLTNNNGLVQGNQSTLHAGEVGNNGGQILQLGSADTSITVDGNLDNRNGTIAGNGHDLDLTAGSVSNDAGVLNHAGDGRLTITSGSVANGTGQIVANHDLTVNGSDVTSSGLIQAGNNAGIAASGKIDNSNGNILADAQLSLDAKGDITNEQGTLQSGQGINLNGNNIDNSGGHIVSLGSGTLAVTAARSLTNSQGEIGVNSALAIHAATIANGGGSITGVGDVAVAGDSLDNTKGAILSQGKLDARASGAIVNAQGTMQSAQALTVASATLDNTKGTVLGTGSEPVNVNVDGSLINDNGFVGGNGQVSVSAASLSNRSGTVYGKGNLAATTIGDIDNSAGTVQSDTALNLNAGGKLTNEGGLVQGNQLTLHAGQASNGNGQIRQLGSVNASIAIDGNLGNQNGTIAGNGHDFNLTVGSVSNDGGMISHAGDGTLTVTGGSIANGTGQMIANHDLAIAGSDITNAGLVQAGNNAAVTATGKIDNSNGSMLAGAQLNLSAQADIVNRQGTLQSGQGMAVSGDNIDNSGGHIVTLGSNSLTINAAHTVTNNQGAIGGNGAVAINAATIDNDNGGMTGVGDVAVAADSLDNTKGAILSQGKLDAKAVNGIINAQGTLQAAKAVTVNAATLDNTKGTLLGTGTDAVNVTAAGNLLNAGGFVGGNGTVAVGAAQLNNQGGTVYGKGDLVAEIGNQIDNGAGTLQSDAGLNVDAGGKLTNDAGLMQGNQLTLHAGDASNAGGQIQQLGNADTSIAVGGLLDNRNGAIASNGQNFNLTAGSMSNAGGAVTHAGDGKLTIAGGDIDNGTGQVVTHGDLAITGHDIANAGLIQAGNNADIAASGKVDNSKGNVLAGAQLNLGAKGDVANSQGTLQSGQGMTVNGDNIDNGNGHVLALGSDALTVTAAHALTNAQGQIGGNGAVAIDAATIANGQGGITGVGNVDLNGASLDNTKGSILSQGGLNARIANGAVNQEGTIQSSQGLTFNAATLDNTKGTLLQTGTQQGNVSLSGGMVNDEGFVGGNGQISVSAASLSNRSGTVYGKGNLTAAASGDIDNSAGTVQSDAALSVGAGGKLTNDGGLVQGNQLTLHAGAASNNGGQLIQLGSADTSIAIDGKLDNQNGTIASNGHDVNVIAGSIDNDAGTIDHAGDGTLTINAGGIANGTGEVIANHDLTINGTDVTNAGLIQSGNNANITTTGKIDNTGGNLLAGTQLSLNATGDVVNTHGTLQSGQALTVSGDNVDNGNGHILALGSGDLNVAATHALTNNQGEIGGNGAVTINAATVSGNQGSITGVGNVGLTTGSLDNTKGSLLSQAAMAVKTDNAITNTEGTIQAAQGLTVDAATLDNTQGAVLQTGVQQANVTIAGNAINANGFMGGNGQVSLSTNDLNNHGGTVYGKDNLAVTANGDLDSSAGKVQSDAALNIDASGKLTNDSGLVQGDQVTLHTGEASNAGGRIQQLGNAGTVITIDGALDNRTGTIASNGHDVNVIAGSIGNDAGTIDHAGDGTLTVNAGGIANGTGEVIANHDLTINGTDITNAGLIQSGNNASITATGKIDNSNGNILAGASATLNAHANLENANGNIQASKSLVIGAAAIGNAGGHIVDLGTDGTTLNTAGDLNNAKGSIAGNGMVSLSAAGLDNTDGSVIGASNVGVTADSIANLRGGIASDAAVNLTSNNALNNRSGTIQSAKAMTVHAASLDNTGGNFLVTGNNALGMTVAGAAVNDSGMIGSNGTIAFNSGSLNNKSGVLYAKGSLSATTAGVDNSAGTIQSDAGLTGRFGGTVTNAGGLIQGNLLALQANVFNNTGGSVQQIGTVDTAFTVNGALSNAGGSIVSKGGNFNVAAGSIDNGDGTFAHLGSGTFTLAADGTVASGSGGRMIANNALSLQAATLDNGGLIQAGGAMGVVIGGKAANEGGSLVAGTTLNVKASGDIANAGGSLEAGQSVVLDAVNVDNTAGAIAAHGTGSSGGATITATQTLTNAGGEISSNAGLIAHVGTLANQNGSILAVGDIDLASGGGFDNTGGAIESNGKLSLAGASLVNAQNGWMQGASLDFSATTIDNTAGTIVQTGSVDTAVQLAGIFKNAGGTFSSAGKNFTLAAQSIDNTGGAINHANTGAFSVDGGTQLTNSGGAIGSNGNVTVSADKVVNTSGGTIESLGTLQAIAANTFDNDGGTLQSSGALSVTAPVLTNVAGSVLSDGAVTISAPQFDNTRGTVSGARLALASSDIANNHGTLYQTGTTALGINAGTIDNTGGTIGSNGVLTVNAGSIINQGGLLQTGKGASLTVHADGSIDNSSGGKIYGDGALSVDAASLDNRTGSMTGAGTLGVTVSGALNNGGGTVAATKDVSVNAGTLQNANGTISSVQGNLAVNGGTGIDNSSGGRIEAADTVTLAADGLNNKLGTVAGGAASIDVGTNTLDNTNGKIAADGTLNVLSGQLVNTGGLLQAGGAMSINTHGQTLTNTQSGSAGGIVGKSTVDIASGALDNEGGYIGGIGAITINAGQIDNTHAGQIFGQNALTLNASGLSNGGGQLQATGDVTIALGSGTLDNTAGLIRSGGTLKADAGTIVNANTNDASHGMEGDSVILTANTITNTNGAIRADNVLEINATQLDNTSALISSAGSIVDKATTTNNTQGTLLAQKSLQMSSSTVQGSGNYFSLGDLVFNYAGGYTNTSKLLANGNLTFTSGGTITNSGVIGASQTLNLSAVNINNQAGGEISAATTNVTASGTLTNQGLIDGTTTSIKGGTVNNTGRIYGDTLNMQIAALNNSGAGTIASRGNASLSATGTISNSGGALIYASGNMLLAAPSIDNASSTIEAGGDLALTGTVTNRNTNFTTHTQTLSTQYLTEYQPVVNQQPTMNHLFVAPAEASLESWSNNDLYYSWHDTTTYPVAKYGSYPYTTAIDWSVCAHAMSCGMVTLYNYTTTDPVWALFGVAPPPANVTDPSGQFPYYSALDRAIAAFNASFYSGTSEDYFIYNITRTTTETVVDSSSPAKLIAGRNLTVTGSLSNDKSQVGGGGTALVNGQKYTQTAVLGAITTTDSGSVIYSDGYDDCHGVLGGCDKARYNAPNGTYTDTSSTPIDLPVVFQSTTLPGAQTQSVNKTVSGAANVAGAVNTHSVTTGAIQVAAGAVNTLAANAQNQHLTSAAADGGNGGLVTAGAPSASHHSEDVAANLATQVKSAVSAADSKGASGNAGDTGNVEVAVHNPTALVGAVISQAATGNAGDADKVATSVQTATALVGASAPHVASGNAGDADKAATAVQTATALVNVVLPHAPSGKAADTPTTQSPSDFHVASLHAASGVQKQNSGTATASAIKEVSVGSVGAVRTSALTIRIPGNALYILHPGPGSNYLVETDPRFADYRTWISSDTMLQQLGADPDKAMKRLGDGFYEQQQVEQQVMLATGQRYLGDYTSDQDEYAALMRAGVEFGKQYHLNIGTALSADQMKLLTDDIVWLVAQTVVLPDGSTQQVLVPQVYVRVQQGDLKGDGTLTAARDIQLNIVGDIENNGGTIAARNVAQLTADNINNLDGRIQGGQVALAARTDINNLSGMITGGDVSLSAGRDVNIVTRTLDTGGLNTTGAQAGTAATVYGNNITVQAGRDIALVGAKVNADGDILLSADRHLDIEAIQTGSTRNLAFGNSAHLNTAEVSHFASDVAAVGNLIALAGAGGNGNLTVRGSNLSAGKDLLAQGTNVTVESAIDSQSIDMLTRPDGGRVVFQQHTENLSGGNLAAGGNLTVVAAGQTDANGKTVPSIGDLTLKGANLNAGGAVAVAANHDIDIVEQQLNQSQHAEVHTSHSSGFLSHSSSDKVDDVKQLQNVGSAVSGDSITLQAGNDLIARAAAVTGVHDVSLTAGNNLTVAAAQDTDTELHTYQESHSGFTSSFSDGVASVGYSKSKVASQSTLDSVTQQGSTIASTAGSTLLKAGQQLTVTASDIAAGKDLTLIGKNIDLQAAQNTVVEHDTQQASGSGFAVGVTYDPYAAFKSAHDQSGKGNNTTSFFGKAMKRDEANIDGTAAATTAVVITADSHSSNSVQDHSTSDARVSTIAAGGNLSMLATGDSITSQGTAISAEGDALLLAKNNITLDVAHTLENQSQNSKTEGHSLDNRGTLPVGMLHDQGNGQGATDTVTGTTLSVGGKATLATTDGDITLTGTNLAATGDVAINAAKNLTIQSAQNSAGNANVSNDKAIGKVVISDTERFAGYHTEDHTDHNQSVTQVDSNVGSINGNVSLTAGDKYTQTASNVLAGNDVAITAKSIDINAADNTGDMQQRDDAHKFGAFARISSPLIDLANNLSAAKQSDGRVKDMQNMAAAANAYQAFSGASAAAGGAGSGYLIKGEVGVGVSSSHSQDQSSYTQAVGSTVNGKGNVTLTSTEGNITATGSDLTAGKTLSLDSAKDILLQAAQNDSKGQGDNQSAGVEVGVGYSVGAKTGFYIYGTANYGHGDYANNGETNSNTHLTGDTVSLTSKGDTTLKGATVTGNTVNADVGGKLAIESLQDTSEQHSNQSNVGVRVQASFGSAWEFSGNASSSGTNGSSAAVKEQSGLFAGDGGYHVKADTVDLKGGAIASTNAKDSELTANALTAEDLQNQMDYKAQSASISGGFQAGGSRSNGASGNNGSQSQQLSTGARNPNVTPGMALQEKGSDSSTTYATVTDGKITIGGKSMDSASGLGLHTDQATASKAIEALPDLQKVSKEQQAMAAAGNTVIATANQIAEDRASVAQKAVQNAQEEVRKANTQQDRDKANADLASAQQDAKNWSPTGDYTRALNVVTGILTGNAAGQGATQLGVNAAAPYAAEAIGDYFAKPGHDSEAAHVLAHAVLGAVLASANGSNAGVGAGAGAAGEVAAQVLTKELYPDAYDADGNFHPEKLTSQQVSTVIALSTGIGALVGGVSGGSLDDVSIGGKIANNAVVNNEFGDHKWLRDKQTRERLEACRNDPDPSGCRQRAIAPANAENKAELLKKFQEDAVASAKAEEERKKQEEQEAQSHTGINGAFNATKDTFQEQVDGFKALPGELDKLVKGDTDPNDLVKAGANGVLNGLDKLSKLDGNSSSYDLTKAATGVLMTVGVPEGEATNVSRIAEVGSDAEKLANTGEKVVGETQAATVASDVNLSQVGAKGEAAAAKASTTENETLQVANGADTTGAGGVATHPDGTNAGGNSAGNASSNVSDPVVGGTSPATAPEQLEQLPTLTGKTSVPTNSVVSDAAANSIEGNLPSALTKIDLGVEIGSGSEKTVYTLQGNNNLVVAVQNSGNQLLVNQEIQALNQIGDLGIPVVKNYGSVTVDGKAAIVLEKVDGVSSRDIYVEGVTGVPGDGGATGNIAASSLLNERSVSDLQNIRSTLVNNGVGIDDLQFLIGKDGRVVVNDPMSVTNSVKPSNLQLIDNLIAIAKSAKP